ncbi:MAG: hypothetical protein PW734_01170 [Verrucomicrobium sp.]|nr:hypothetical protein [Verrucomicrobium sp.]
MFFVQIAICLTLCIMLSGGSMMTAKSEMAALRASQLLSFYTQDMPSVNLTVQKLVAGAQSFAIFGGSASDALASAAGTQNGTSTPNLTASNGLAVRLVYPKSDTTGLYTIGILYYDQANHALRFGTGTSSNANAAFTPSNIWTVAGPTASNVNFSVNFGVADTSDANAAGLLVLTLVQGDRQVTFYAERF